VQIPIPPRRGQARPWTSIPRINWAHPLTWGLATYAFDCGGGVFIDLVSGQTGARATTGAATAAKAAPSRYGGGMLFVQQSTTSLSSRIVFPHSKHTEYPAAAGGMTGAAPYSYACGFVPKSPINASGSHTVLYEFGDALVDTFYQVGDQGTGVPICNYSNNGDNPFTSSRAWVPNNFTTVVGVLLSTAASGTAVQYYMDSSGYFEVNNLTAVAPGLNTSLTAQIIIADSRTSGTPANNFFNGWVHYGCSWSQRILTKAEAVSLQNDPWQFLIWPEDEMFATLVGVTAAAQTLGWWGDQEYVPPQLPLRTQAYPTTAFVPLPRQVLGWNPTFPDSAPRKPPPNFAHYEPFTAFGTPPRITTGWTPSNDYTPRRPANFAHYEPFIAFGTPPRITTGWTPSNDYTPRRPPTFAHYEPFTAFGTPPRITTGWATLFADRVPGALRSPDFPFLAWAPQTIAAQVVTGWLFNNDYVPRRLLQLAQFEPFTAFGTEPRITTGWGPSFPDYVLRKPPSADNPFLAWGSHFPIVPSTGWMGSDDYTPRRPPSFAHFDVFTALGQPPILALGWLLDSSEYVPRRQYPTDAPAAVLPPQFTQQVVVTGWLIDNEYRPLPRPVIAHLLPSGPVIGTLPPPVVVGWIAISADFAPAKLNDAYYLNLATLAMPVVYPIPPNPPTPTGPTGEFRVSGSEVRDRFPVSGVVYTYASITDRTN